MTMSAAEMKARYLAYLDALLHPDALPPLLADGFVAHDLPPGVSLPDFRRRALAALPDTEVDVLHLAADGDLVAAHLRLRGTHRGVLRGIPPTGRALSAELFDLVRFDGDGKVAERWGLLDWDALYRQMGVTALPPG